MRCSVTAGEDEGVGCVRSGWRCEDDSAWGDNDAKGMGLGGSKTVMWAEMARTFANRDPRGPYRKRSHSNLRMRWMSVAVRL